MSYVARVEGKLTNGFALVQEFRADTEKEATEQANEFVEANAEMLDEQATTMEVKEAPRFDHPASQLISQLACTIAERTSEDPSPWTREQVEDAFDTLTPDYVFNTFVETTVDHAAEYLVDNGNLPETD